MRIIGLPTLSRTVLTHVRAVGCWLAVLVLCMAWVSSEAADFFWDGTAGGNSTDVGVIDGTDQSVNVLNRGVLRAVTPVISSAATARWEVGVVTGYQISASGTPTLYGATGLPPGVAIDTATGLISGTITTVGAWTVALTAGNVAGTGTGSLLLTSFLQLPIITSATTVSVTINTAFTYQIVAGSAPAAYTAPGCPPA